MAFDPTSAYVVVQDIDGKRYARQSTTYYDMYGNGFTALPGSINGYHAPTDPTLVAALTSGTILGLTRFGILAGAGITSAVALTTTGTATLSTAQTSALTTAQLATLCTNNDLIVTALKNIGIST